MQAQLQQDMQAQVQRRAITIRQAAKRLGCHPITIYRRIENGEIRAIQSTGKKYGKWLISVDEFESKYKDQLQLLGQR